MDNLKGKRVLIFQQRGWGKGIGRFLAKKLYEEGAILAAVTFKRNTHGSIVQQTDAKYELIISNDDIVSNPKKYLGDSNYSLKEICAALGVDSIWPIVSTVRWYARSYKDKYYYSFRQNVSDEVIADYVKATYKTIKIVQEKFKPDVVIVPNFIEAFHIMYSLFFEKMGVPVMALTVSKVSGVYVMIRSFNEDKGDFIDRINDLNDKKVTSSNLLKARKYIEEFRNKLKKPEGTQPGALEKKRASLKEIIINELRPYYHVLKWYLKPQIMRVNYWESVGPSIDYKPPRIILRDYYSQKRYKKFFKNYDYYQFEKLDKFAYYPLQVQPEQSLDTTAPFFNNQIEVIRQIAMSLPDDYVLAVKEHPVMLDKRPPSYIEKIEKTPNVKIIDSRISTEEILKKASLVVNQNSTTTAEAAFYSKPVIQLGNLGTTLKLPNVFKHTDMSTLSSKIKEVLGVNLHNEEYERRLENYVAAAYDVGIEFNYNGVWSLGEKGDMEKLWQFYKKNILS